MGAGTAAKPDAADAAARRFPRARRLLGNLALLTLIVGAVVATCLLLYRIEAGRIADQQAQRESLRVNLLTRLLSIELQPIASDLRLLADGDALRAWLETGDAQHLQAAVRRASFISVNKPAYDQVRYISEDGQEVLRVNQGGKVVPLPQLQNKGDRDYFQQASQLPPESIYVSLST